MWNLYLSIYKPKLNLAFNVTAKTNDHEKPDISHFQFLEGNDLYSLFSTVSLVPFPKISFLFEDAVTQWSDSEQ